MKSLQIRSNRNQREKRKRGGERNKHMIIHHPGFIYLLLFFRGDMRNKHKNNLFLYLTKKEQHPILKFLGLFMWYK